jgi:hypothetical protein
METTMTNLSRVSAAALALAASAAVGAAQADTYYYTDDPVGTYSDTAVPNSNYYYSEPTIVAPAPRVYYAPVYTERSNTTYYHSGETHDGRVGSSPAYRTYYEPRVIYAPPATVYSAPVQTYSYTTPYHYSPPPPYGYVPPGLSINVGTGTYGPLYGGWNTYSNEHVGGYDSYRTTTDR